MWSDGLVSVDSKLCARVFAFAGCATHTQWNEPSIKFYQNVLGATAMSEWMGMRLEEEGIERLKQFEKK